MASAKPDTFDAAELSLIARSAGLHDLRFDAALAPDRGREVQSVHDAQGRIVGWFSWAPDRGFIGAMAWLWGLLGLVGIALALAAYISVRATRRLSASLARSMVTVRKLTTQDPLTGLPNRRVMLERLDEAVATRGARFVAFALIDIDGFHDVNDTLGRAGGDTMLCSIAERLKAALPPGALFGRFEDDEFAAIVTGDDAGIAAALAEKLSASLAAPIYMDQSWQISASIGTAKAPDDGTTGDELQRDAALALRAAKRGGRGSVRHFVPEIHVEHAERRFFLRELETAIGENAFDVHYQPVVAAEGGGMVGVEALLRWNHPTRGAIAPSVFIPLAEQSGLMIRLGEFVLRRALADGARWPNLFVSGQPVAGADPRAAGSSIWSLRVLAETGMAAPRLVLEVTEGVLIDDPEDTQHKLEALRALGVTIALDDFGTGYSSLSYLQKFPFRPAQDRPHLRRFARHYGQCRRHHPVDRHARSCARHEGAGRRHRDQRAAGAAAARRLRRDAGLSVRQSRVRPRRSTGSWRSHQAAPRRAARRQCGILTGGGRAAIYKSVLFARAAEGRAQC